MTQHHNTNFPAGGVNRFRFLPRTLPVLLAGALQLMPMLRSALPLATSGFAPSAWAIVLKLAGAATVFALGHHAVSAASSLSAPAAATVGVAYNGATTYSGGHASSVQSWQVNTNWQSAALSCAANYPIAPGLTLTMNPTFKYIGIISGTPTQAGTFSIKVTVWSGSGCSGGDNDVRYTAITVNPGSSSAPVWTTPLTNRTVTAGSTTTFAAAASGTPAPGFYWKSNNVPIAGAAAATYQIANVQPTHAGNYTIFATNSGGVISNTAALTVIAPPTSQTNAAGANATFTVAGNSPQALTYRWQFQGAAIAAATNATFTTNNVSPASAGTYTVIVSNAVAAATYSAALVVTAVPPVITIPPTNATVTAGQPAVFSVIATGTGPLTYQWRKNLTNLITGATNATYGIAKANKAEAGSFTVIVANLAGSASNAVPAMLTVNPPPPPVSGPVAMLPGKFLFTFTPVVGLTNVVLTNGSTAAAGWGVLTNVPPPASASPVTVTDATPAGAARFYRVMVVP